MTAASTSLFLVNGRMQSLSESQIHNTLQHADFASVVFTAVTLTSPSDLHAVWDHHLHAVPAAWCAHRTFVARPRRTRPPKSACECTRNTSVASAAESAPTWICNRLHGWSTSTRSVLPCQIIDLTHLPSRGPGFPGQPLPFPPTIPTDSPVIPPPCSPPAPPAPPRRNGTLCDYVSPT
jgi:hypothetical protein